IEPNSSKKSPLIDNFARPLSTSFALISPPCQGPKKGCSNAVGRLRIPPSFGYPHPSGAGQARRSPAAPVRGAARPRHGAPGEPPSKAALERPRAADCQLARLHGAAKLRPSDVHAVERRGVDSHLEVDIESWVLQAHRHLGGLEHHPIALLGIAEVELHNGAV